MDDLDLARTLATSAAIGFLVGLERERNPLTKAGLRTFTLVAAMGAISTLLAQSLASGWIVAAALVVVGVAIGGASLMDPRTIEDDSGTTTTMAAVVVFGLGALVALGDHTLAVAGGVSVAALLYFKTELEGFSQRLTPQDLRTVLRFAVLSAVILPLLPDRPLAGSGPFAAVNPRNLWLMVVLISGVSLAGYVAWRLTLGRHGLLVTGALGGMASSTATTVVAARQVKEGASTSSQALVVILLANAAMLARVTLVVAIVAPTLGTRVATVVLPALVACIPAFAWHWRHAVHAPDTGEGTYRNPAGLGVALGFAAAYGVVLVLAGWARESLGTAGLFALAAVSGLTDVDAITLSSARLTAVGDLDVAAAATAIGIAVAANLVAKAGFVFATGGRALGMRTAAGFALPLAALAAGAVLA